MSILFDFQRRSGIFYDGAKQSLCQVHSVLIHQVMEPGHQPKGLGISFNTEKILPHLFCQNLAEKLNFSVFPLIGNPGQICPEPVPDGSFSKMSERGIAHIVQKAGTLKNIARNVLILRQKFRIGAFHQQPFADVLPQ